MPEQSVHIAGYSGGALSVAAGACFRVTDVEGSQIADFFALSTNNHFEYLSTAVTRMVNHTLFPKPGEPFYSTLHHPIVTFMEDNSPGVHDMLFAPCDHQLYADRGLVDHPNCRDNYSSAAHSSGIEHDVVPDPVNLFQNTPVNDDGSLSLGLAVSAAGDSVVLRAEVDIIVIVTACSSERVNGGGSTPILLSHCD